MWEKTLWGTLTPASLLLPLCPTGPLIGTAAFGKVNNHMDIFISSLFTTLYYILLKVALLSLEGIEKKEEPARSASELLVTDNI